MNKKTLVSLLAAPAVLALSVSAFAQDTTTTTTTVTSSGNKGILGLLIGLVLAIVIGVINLLIALWIATYVIGLTIKILDKMTKNIEEMAEIAKGNVAVSLMVTGVLLAVSTVVAQGVEGISKILNVQSVGAAIGLNL